MEYSSLEQYADHTVIEYRDLFAFYVLHHLLPRAVHKEPTLEERHFDHRFQGDHEGQQIFLLKVMILIQIIYLPRAAEGGTPGDGTLEITLQAEQYTLLRRYESNFRSRNAQQGDSGIRRGRRHSR